MSNVMASSSTGRQRVFTLLVLLLGALSGVLLASGNNYLTLLVFGAVGAALFLNANVLTSLTALALLCFVIVGQLMYFANIGQAVLIPYGVALALFVLIPGLYFSALNKHPNGLRIPNGPLLVGYGICIVFSALINLSSPLQVLVGGKSLFAFASVLLIVTLTFNRMRMFKLMPRFLLWLVIFQLPFVLYQFFFVAKNRKSAGAEGVSWDAVVGAFGGDPMSGGASGVLAYFVVLAVVVVFTFYKLGCFSRKLMTLAVIAGIICVGLAEVKLVVILMPLAFVILSSSLIKKYPVRTFFSLIFGVVLAVSVIYSYAFIHYADKNNGNFTTADLIDYTFGYSTDPEHINYETKEMGRVAAISFWYSEGFVKDPIRGFFGYGPGASRAKSNFAPGEVASRYPFYIDRSAATQMLWDIGLIGLLVFILINIRAMMWALRMASDHNLGDEYDRAGLQVCAVAIGLVLLMIPYGRDVLEVPSLAFFNMFVLGAVGAWKLRERLGIAAAIKG